MMKQRLLCSLRLEVVVFKEKFGKLALIGKTLLPSFEKYVFNQPKKSPNLRNS